MHVFPRPLLALLLALSLLSVAMAADPVPAVKKGDAPQPVEVKRGHVPSFPRVITGKITDAGGKPVSGALVEWGPDYPHDAPREVTRSAADGTYRLEVQKAGRHFKLGISAAGMSPQWGGTLIPGPRSAPSELDFKLAPETTLRIAIVGEGGQPIPNLEVTPMTPGSGFHSSFSSVQQPEPIPGHDKRVPCDEQGVCLLRQLLPAPAPLKEKAAGDNPAMAEHKVHFNQEGWLSLRITRNGKWVHELQISREGFFKSPGQVRVVVPDYRNPLIEGKYDGTIFGQVVDAGGQPVQDYHVTLRHRPVPLAVNDAEGRFKFGQKLDPQREYEVRIFANGFAPQTSRIAPQTTSQDKPSRIELKPHKSVEFQLLDGQTQKPVPNILVVSGLSKQKGWNYVEWNNLGDYADGSHGLENVLRVTSNAEGRITVPEGDVPATLIILTPGFARLVVTPTLRPAPADTGLVQISLPTAASIQGFAAPGSRLSQQASGVSLYFTSPDGFDNMFHNLKLDDKGEWMIESLAPGDYQVGLMHSDGNMSTTCWQKRVHLKAGEQLKLPLGEMTGPLTLSGRTSPFTQVAISRKPKPSGATTDPANSTSGVTHAATISDIDGYYELDHVEAGAYQIQLDGLNRFSGGGNLTGGSGPAEVQLTEDTHVDYVAGTITPANAAVQSPAKK